MEVQLVGLKADIVTCAIRTICDMEEQCSSNIRFRCSSSLLLVTQNFQSQSVVSNKKTCPVLQLTRKLKEQRNNLYDFLRCSKFPGRKTKYTLHCLMKKKYGNKAVMLLNIPQKNLFCWQYLYMRKEMLKNPLEDTKYICFLRISIFA